MNNIIIQAAGQDALQLNSVNAIQIADGMIANAVDVEVFKDFIQAIVEFTNAIGARIHAGA